MLGAADLVPIQFFQPHALRLLPSCLPAAALVTAACLFKAPTAQAQTLASTVGLSFGAFIAGTGGTVTVNANGWRSKTGGAALIGQASSTAAQFFVQGTAAATYAITLPADGSVTLMDTSGLSMALNGFVSYPSATGTLSGGGMQTLSVGATLSVNNAQPRGSYSGSFPVTVHYN